MGRARVPSTPQGDNSSEPSVGAGGEERIPPSKGEGSSETKDLAAIWLGEMPADQLAIWAGMSQAHRALAIKRLGAVLAYEAGGSRNASNYVDPDQLSLPRFYSMLRAWGADRSLLSLVPQARRRAPRAFVAPVGIEAAAKEAVLSSPGDSREVIAKALHDRYGQPSLSWMRRLVAKVQRDHEREIEGGAAGFAKRIVVDSTALPLPLLSIHEGAPERETDEEDEFEWAVTALAWDAATGFILGRALDRAPADMGLHAVAAADASDCLRRMKLTVKSQVGAVVATTVPLQGEDAMETLRLMDRLSSDGAEIIDAKQTAGSASASEPVVATTLPLEGRDAMETLRLMNRLSSDGVDVIHSARAAGSELMKTFEGRIGKLELRPRFAADAYVGRTSRASALAKSGRIPMSVAEARVVIDHEIAAHNAAIMEAGLTAAVTPAIAADALDRVFRRYLPG